MIMKIILLIIGIIEIRLIIVIIGIIVTMMLIMCWL